MELSFIKTTLQIHFWKWSQRKRCSKRTICTAAPFSLMLKVCSPEIPTSTKTGSKKNVSWERSEIPRKYPGVLEWSYSIKVAGLLSRTYPLLKKKLFIYFSGGVWNSRKIKHFVQFDLFNILLTSILKETPLQMLPLSVKRLFKIPGKPSVVESIFSKVTGEI